MALSCSGVSAVSATDRTLVSPVTSYGMNVIGAQLADDDFRMGGQEDLRRRFLVLIVDGRREKVFE